VFDASIPKLFVYLRADGVESFGFENLNSETAKPSTSSSITRIRLFPSSRYECLEYVLEEMSEEIDDNQN
jgi:hypothetical protein